MEGELEHERCRKPVYFTLMSSRNAVHIPELHTQVVSGPESGKGCDGLCCCGCLWSANGRSLFALEYFSIVFFDRVRSLETHMPRSFSESQAC